MASTDPCQQTPKAPARSLPPAMLVQLAPQASWPLTIELDQTPCLLNDQATVSWQGRAHHIGCRPGYTHLWVNDHAVTSRLLEGRDRIRLGQQLMVYLTRDDLVNHHQSIFYTLGSTDALTNVAHQAFWMQAFYRELHLAQRTTQPLSILLLDIDQFAAFNRQHGPYIGDQALVALVARVEPLLRRGDLMARWSGDKFAVLCAHTDLHGALVVAQRIRTAISNQPLPLANHNQDSSHQIRLALSLGVAECSVSSSDERTSFDVQSLAAVLLAEAENYLRTAKRQGGDRVVSCISPAVLPNLDHPTTAIPTVSHGCP